MHAHHTPKTLPTFSSLKENVKVKSFNQINWANVEKHAGLIVLHATKYDPIQSNYSCQN